MNPHAEKSSDVTSSGPWSGCNQSGIVRDKRGVVVASCVKADWAGEVAKLPELLAAGLVVESGAPEKPQIAHKNAETAINEQKQPFSAFSHRWVGIPIACIVFGATIGACACVAGFWLGWW